MHESGQHILQPVNIKDTSKRIRPIIKWTGGKFDEFPMFSNYIPSYRRYYEPFFGGGGVFFASKPTGESFLNDKSKDLISFYSLIDSVKFQKQLLVYADAWDEAGDLAIEITPLLIPLFQQFMNHNMEFAALHESICKIINDRSGKSDSILFDNSFIVQRDAFIKKLSHSISDKMKRITAISVKEKRVFHLDELPDHIETGIKSGLYLFLRSLSNEFSLGKLSMPKEKAVANWYFVREFCYASMFRFNAKGEFNIPYGGIAYNRKDFRQKVNNIFHPGIADLFSNANFYNNDFEDFIATAKPRKGDFIFVDPPYDSEFSEYDQNAFTKDDQVRLRDVLVSTPAKFMMVIKETDFIRNLYKHHCRLIEFDKTYTYNVRGRNNRDTKHLIIINYDLISDALHPPK
jgi:DNA adenine methylase